MSNPLMQLSTVTGEQIAFAYHQLYPGEIHPEDYPLMIGRFNAWLASVRLGDVRFNLALDQSFTGKKTRALLTVMKLETPARLHHVVVGLGLWEIATRFLLKARAEQMKPKPKPPNQD